jgi:NADPH-dependent ferric siderophore reductase
MNRSRYRAHPLVLRCVQVRRVEDITPRMRRVTVGGPQLGEFTRDGMTFPAFDAPMFDDHVKLIFAPGGDIADAVPHQSENGIDWRPSEHRETRDYTPHHHDPAALEVSFDFVVHTSDRHAGGPAEAWARSAQPGDDLWFVGPKASTIIPDDVDEMILIGDETAVPAIDRFFTERPVDGPARAIITISDYRARQDILTRTGDSVTWVLAEPGDRDAFTAAVASVPAPRGVGYVWAAAESRALLALRRHISREWGILKSHTDITGYWHIRDEPGVDADTESDTSATRAEIGSPVPWLATRAALKLGLLDAVAAGPRDRAELADSLNVAAAQIDPVINVLLDAAVLRLDGDKISIGEYGERLVDDDHAREEFDSLYADQVLALAGLADAVTARRSAWEHRTGATLRRHVASAADRYDELVDEADGLTFLMPALARLPLWRGYSDISIGGPAALVVADGLRDGGVKASMRIVEEAEPLSALRRADSQGDKDFGEEWTRTDVMVLASACEHRTDDEVIGHLRELVEIADSLILVESTEPDALNTRATEMALVHLGAVGVPPRTQVDIERLTTAAGWSIVTSTPLGWGVDCIELTPTES